MGGLRRPKLMPAEKVLDRDRATPTVQEAPARWNRHLCRNRLGGTCFAAHETLASHSRRWQPHCGRCTNLARLPCCFEQVLRKPVLSRNLDVTRPNVHKALTRAAHGGSRKLHLICEHAQTERKRERHTHTHTERHKHAQIFRVSRSYLLYLGFRP